MSLLLTNTQGKAFVINANDTTVPYQRVEYIGINSSSAYIDTGLIPSGENITIKGKFYLKSYIGAYAGWFGAYRSDSYATYRIIRANTDDSTVYFNCGGRGSVSGVFSNLAVDNIYEFTLTYDSLTLNGVTVTYTPTAAGGINNTLKLFRATGANEALGNYYYFQVYDSDVLVLNLIPVRIGQVGYMYDRISGQLFGNAGTGNFVIGPDIPSKALCVPMQGVEYLESTGTQYIDTGLIGDSELDYEITFRIITGGGTYQNILGDRLSVSSRRYSLMVGLSYMQYYYNCGNSNEVDSPRNTYTSDVTTARKTGLDIYLRDSLIGTFAQQTFTTPNSIILFGARNNGTLSSPMNGRIYSASFSRNGTVVHDFIPVRVGNVGYMYDRVSGQLFGNAGTGDFVIGPDIKPVQLVKNGNFTEGADGLDYWDTVYPAIPSVTDGVLRLEKSTYGTMGAMVVSTSAAGAVSNTHVYYLKAELKADTITAYAGFCTSSYSVGGNTYVANTEMDWVKKDVILSPVNNTDLVNCRAGASTSGAHTYAFARNIYLIDLTATFGAGNEPDLATCRQIFTESYYPYYNPNE